MISHFLKGSENIARAGVLIDLAILVMLTIDVYISYQNATALRSVKPAARRFSW